MNPLFYFKYGFLYGSLFGSSITYAITKIYMNSKYKLYILDNTVKMNK